MFAELPSLSEAIVTLFREKKVLTGLGQFSRIILLHHIYQEIFHLKDYFSSTLGDWEPTHATEANADMFRSWDVANFEGKTLLNSWRNAALDCIDVLHWAANSTIALQAGVEHPAVLHLHLSRTVVLFHFERIQILVDSIVSFAQSAPSNTLDPLERKRAVDAERGILEWAQRDQCKARLAVLHSGCLF